MDTRDCARCGAPFTPRAAGQAQKFCSPECRRGPRKANAPARACKHCGKSLVIDSSKTGPAPTYCSQSCRSKAHRARYTARGERPPWEQRARDEYVPVRIQLECPYCGAAFVSRRRDAAHCGSANCKRLYRNHRMRYHNSLRRARLRGLETTGSSPFFRAGDIFDRDGWICFVCREEIDPTLPYPDPRSVTLEHITPLAAGGRHRPENVTCSHLECNNRRPRDGRDLQG